MVFRRRPTQGDEPVESSNKVAIAGDNADASAVLARLIAADGYSISQPQTADELDRTLESEPHLCVVLDAARPDPGNVLDLIARIRHHPDPSVNRTPIVVITHHQVSADDVIALGADTVLSRPVRSTRVIESIAAASRTSSATPPPQVG